MLISYFEPKLIIWPLVLFLDLIASSKPFVISSIKLKFLLVSKLPNFINFLLSIIWFIIVGITALKDCLGPKVLKGLRIVIGSL